MKSQGESELMAQHVLWIFVEYCKAPNDWSYFFGVEDGMFFLGVIGVSR